MSHRLSILQSATREQVQMSPYPHLVLPACLPEDIYGELSDTYPSDALICELDRWRRPNPGENKRVDLSAKLLLNNRNRVSSIWSDFVAYHTSREFFEELLTIFGDGIATCYPDLESRMGTLRELQTGVRFCEQTDRHPLSLECQVGINTPGAATSTVIGPHCDSPDELYAGLLYFKRPEDRATGGNLDLYRWRDGQSKLFRRGHAVADAGLIEKLTTIPAAANTLVMFINSVDAVHGVTPRSPSIVSRRLVNIIGEVYNAIPGGLFERPQVPEPQDAGESQVPRSLAARLRHKAKAKVLALKNSLLTKRS